MGSALVRLDIALGGCRSQCFCAILGLASPRAPRQVCSSWSSTVQLWAPAQCCHSTLRLAGLLAKGCWPTVSLEVVVGRLGERHQAASLEPPTAGHQCSVVVAKVAAEVEDSVDDDGDD